jgi:hypothetical protein
MHQQSKGSPSGRFIYGTTIESPTDSVILPTLDVIAQEQNHQDLEDQLTAHKNLYTLLQTRPAAEVEDTIQQIRVGERLQSILQQNECGNALSQLGNAQQKRQEKRAQHSQSLMTERSYSYVSQASSSQIRIQVPEFRRLPPHRQLTSSCAYALYRVGRSCELTLR